MAYSKIPFQAGIYKDDSPLEAKGYWISADKIRFVRGLPETIYGWERASTSTLLGLTRGMMTWADNSRNPYAAFGTNLREYAMDADGNITDITPWSSRGYSQLTFTTASSSTLVSVAWASHGLVADQKVTLELPSTTAVAGVTIASSFAVASVVDANNITYNALQAASGALTQTVAVLYTQFLAPGQADGLGGFGFGTGGFGSGSYGSSSSSLLLYPRTVSHAPWGQNLIFNPRGGGVYEWAPNTANTELITNGTFTGSATGWTLGSGWAYGSNNVASTNATATLSQVITLPAGAWCRAVVNCPSYSYGVANVQIGSSYIGTTIQASGVMAASFYTGAGGSRTFAVLPGSTLGITLDDISIQAQSYGNIIPNAPTAVTCSFTTAERILVACGCADNNNNFDPMRVRWTDTQNNQTWTAAASNLAGSYTLTNGSRIVRGMSGNRENVVLTDTALYAMRFVPDPNVVYSFTEIASGCGLIGPNAVTQLAGVFFWMGSSGEFYQYDGGFPMPLQCTLKRDVQDNLAWVQQDKIFAFPNAKNTEIWWLYPDARDGVECSRYVVYNVLDQTWSCGTFNRTSWVDAGIFQYPLAIDATGTIWFHEKGTSQDGGPRSWSITSAYFDLGDGNEQMRINGIQPDAGSLQGNYSIQIDTRIHNGAGILSRTFGPYNVTSATGKVSARANGQEAKLTFSANTAPTFWRLGAVRIDTTPVGRKR
jgi:hypothetical protein